MQAWFSISLAVLAMAAAALGQNSTRKIRPRPSALAERAGSAVAWRPDLADARARAKATGRPLFWYVPTLSGSPMDRKPEIDRYMRSGPFSDGDVVHLLNAAFVAVAQPASRAEARGLRQPQFIEPGFVVFDPEGKELLRCHSLVTLHAEWFAARLRSVAGVTVPEREVAGPVRRARAALRVADYAAVGHVLSDAVLDELAPAARAEAGWLRGAALFRAQRDDAARAEWERVARDLPEQPYAWKAAAEVEGHGPFVHGFELYVGLPAAVLAGATETSRAPDGAYDELAARRAGLAFLCAMQRPDGSFRDSRYDFGGTDSLPNVYFAVTALAASALLEERTEPVPGMEPAILAAASRAFGRAVDYLGDDAHLAGDDRDEIVWSHVYRMRLCARWIQIDPKARPRALPLLERSVAALHELQSRNGAWFHEYANPFVTASVLCAMHAAQGVGVGVQTDVVERGLRALAACRSERGGFSYSQARGRVSTPVAGSACRMPRCELALALWQEGREALLHAAVEAAFEHHAALEAVRKYDDHADRSGHGGFFFWYDMLGRTEAMLALQDVAARDAFVARQRASILGIAEIDGCFVDSHELGRVYGTSVALLCLARLRQ